MGVRVPLLAQPDPKQSELVTRRRSKRLHRRSRPVQEFWMGFGWPPNPALGGSPRSCPASRCAAIRHADWKSLSPMRPRRQSGLVCGTLLALLAPACGNAPPPPPPPPLVTRTVQTIGTTFQPATIEVPVGTIVLWSDLDGTQHIVTSGVGSNDPSAGNLFALSLTDHNTVQFTFDTPGVFPYFCRI